jgi:hypothetical protein
VIRYTIARWLTLVALLGMIVWSASGLPDYGRHIIDLWGEPVGQKGVIAIDGPAGTGWRARARAAGKTPAHSLWATVWLWTFDQSERIGRHSDVYLNLPSPILYYYGTFFWYPSRLHVDADGIALTDQEALSKSRVYDPGEFENLRDRGFEYVVAPTLEGFGLVPLRDETGSESP